jgi:hypothetical protein
VPRHDEAPASERRALFALFIWPTKGEVRLTETSGLLALHRPDFWPACPEL